MLEIRRLTTQLKLKQGTFPVVSELSFTLNKGKTLAIVGESGCGKSMAALSIMRILPEPPALPTTGEVLLDGVDLLKLSQRQMRKVRGKKIAMVFQDPMSALNPVYTIGDQLSEVGVTHLGLSPEQSLEKVLAALDDVGIPRPKECVKSYPHQLSGGMKQRAMIAMALLCEPEVLIADEPTTALDVTIQKQVLDLMKDLQRRKGTAILLITHDMGVVKEMADDVLVMYATKMREKGKRSVLFENPLHPYTQGLFSSLPSAQPRGEDLYCIEGMVPSIEHLPAGCQFHPRCPHVMGICKQGEVPIFEKEEQKVKCWLHK